MKNTFFVPGDNVTPEQLQSVRDFEARQAQQREDFLATIPKKEIPDFMNPPFIPYEDRVLVFPDPVEIKTKGGIIVPESVTANVRPLTGTVVRVGPGKPGVAYRHDTQNKHDALHPVGLPMVEGERIFYGAFAGTDFDINGITYKIMRFSDCFGRAL
jgi:chaperonin GroES